MSQKTTCLKRAVALPPLPEQQQLEFCGRGDAKLAELSAVPLHEQPASFGLRQKRRETLEMDRNSLRVLYALMNRSSICNPSWITTTFFGGSKLKPADANARSEARRLLLTRRTPAPAPAGRQPVAPPPLQGRARR